MIGNDGSIARLWVIEDDMASCCVIFQKAQIFESFDELF